MGEPDVTITRKHLHAESLDGTKARTWLHDLYASLLSLLEPIVAARKPTICRDLDTHLAAGPHINHLCSIEQNGKVCSDLVKASKSAEACFLESEQTTCQSQRSHASVRRCSWRATVLTVQIRRCVRHNRGRISTRRLTEKAFLHCSKTFVTESAVHSRAL